ATVVPKTGETVNLLDRKLFNDSDLAVMRERQGGGGGGAFGEPIEEPSDPATSAATTNPSDAAVQAEENARDREIRREVAQEATETAARAERERSIPWIIGTSVGFEVIILAWGAWVFCRRDY